MPDFWPTSANVAERRPDGCLLWTGRLDPDGYGVLWVVEHRRARLAHRLAWLLAKGSFPNGFHVMHRCDNRACVNVDHLFLGTQADVIANMTARGRQAVGERCRSAKLTADQVREMRRRHETGDATYRQLATELGLYLRHVRRIIKRENWKHV